MLRVSRPLVSLYYAPLDMLNVLFSDIDECAMGGNVSYCDANALCLNLYGSYNCKCKEGTSTFYMNSYDIYSKMNDLSSIRNLTLNVETLTEL